MRKVWFSNLDEPLCVPRDVSTSNWDPYAGNRENCDIFDVDQSDPSQWNGGYQTFQIAVNKISINFVKEKLPTEAKEILIMLYNNIKPKKKSIGFFFIIHVDQINFLNFLYLIVFSYLQYTKTIQC